MATTTRILDANVNGTVYTSNANSALEALDTCHSGALAPTDEVANGKLWLDTSTTPGILKIYNNATWEVVVNTTNVTASGALMDSELTDIASVKALDQGVATTDSPTFADVTATSLVVNGNNYPSAGALSNRNLIINGAMQVAQRGTSFTGITGGSAKYTLDRYFADISTSTSVAMTVAQSSDAPQGLNSSLGVTLTTSGATGAGDYSYLRQMIEGYNFAHLNFGTANAQTFTLSFWVKSSLTGTFGGYLGAAVNARFRTFSYTISVADTWEYKTITVSGDTAGTWNATNGVGLQVAWSLSCGTTYLGATGTWGASLLLGATGQTNLTETSGATLNITGVQLEVGDTATPFEHRSYGQELALCQRYYYIPPQGPLHIAASGKGIFNISPPVAFRSSPTASIGRTNPYVENVPWVSVGNVTGIGLDGGHLNNYGGDLLLAGTYVQAHSYGDIWLLGSDELSLDAEL